VRVQVPPSAPRLWLNCSVPTAYGHREVLVRGYVHELEIAYAVEEIAQDPRLLRARRTSSPTRCITWCCWNGGLERKIGGLDQAAPLVGLELPEEFATLRPLLDARIGKPGKREFKSCACWRCSEAMMCWAGVREAIARGVTGFDAVKHLGLNTRSSARFIANMSRFSLYRERSGL
jgi:hypothetical protein